MVMQDIQDEPREITGDEASVAAGGGGRGRVLFGTQGYNYDQWTGLIYPKGTPPKRRLAHYATLFDLAEIDYTYYRPPSQNTVDSWANDTPETFTIAAKVPMSITQEAKLAGDDARRQLAYFFAVMSRLGPRLGPLVFQMSPGFTFPREYAGMEETLRALPELGAAGLRLAMEFRHPSWLGHPEVLALLRERGVAWVWNDWEPTEKYLKPMPRAIDEPDARHVTCDDWGYVRLVGNHKLEIDFRSIVLDRTSDLERWAKLVLAFRRGREDRDIYVLLNNHYAGFSAASIQELQRMLDVPVVTFGGPPAGGESGNGHTGSSRPTGARRHAAQPEQVPLF